MKRWGGTKVGGEGGEREGVGGEEEGGRMRRVRGKDGGRGGWGERGEEEE